MALKTGKRKGFTLIELLIVIAIIAVLAIVVILSLNPAELLRQARDSNRISDMATIKSALALYLADVATPALGTAGNCYVSIATSAGFAVPNQGGTWVTGSSSCNSWFSTASTTVNSSSRSINGSGWIPVNFNAISSGAPIGQVPIDPVNASGTPSCTGTSPSLSSCALFYGYIISGTTFETSAFMESKKFSHGGSADVETGAGTGNTYVYEQGTNLGL